MAGVIEPKLDDREEVASVRSNLGSFFGVESVPDAVLAQNPYGVAFALGRREQLGIDPAVFKRTLDAVTDRDLRRVAAEVFAPARHAVAFIVPED